MAVDNKIKARIICKGLVQGVGFRYFVHTKASNYGLQGITKNLYNGDVETIVEGNKADVEKLHSDLKTGPSAAHVDKCEIEYLPYDGNMIGFEML